MSEIAAATSISPEDRPERPRKLQTQTPPPGLSAQPFCSHCRATQTPLWRRNPDDSASVLCNACGLFLKLKGMPRPLSLKTDVPRTRKRQKACEKEHNAEGSTFKYKKKQPKLESSADPDNDDNDRDGDADSDRLDTKINLDGSPNENSSLKRPDSPKRQAMPKDYDYTAPYMIKRPRKSKYDITEMAPPKSILETLGIEPIPGGQGKLDSQSISKLVGGIAPLNNSQLQNAHAQVQQNEQLGQLGQQEQYEHNEDHDPDQYDEARHLHNSSTSQHDEPQDSHRLTSHPLTIDDVSGSGSHKSLAPFVNHYSSINPASSLATQAAQVPYQSEVSEQVTSRPMLQSHTSSPIIPYQAHTHSRPMSQSLSAILNSHHKSASASNNSYEPVDQLRLLKAQVQELERAYEGALDKLDRCDKCENDHNHDDVKDTSTESSSEGIQCDDSSTHNTAEEAPRRSERSERRNKSKSKSMNNNLSCEDSEQYENIRFKRTEKRIKRLCASDRTGLRMCTWHDAHHSPPLYPPRGAPPGIMSCGCTFDQTLFEETLSRHGVGSIQPGDVTRLDVKMRDNLLGLLEWQYGYVDGDLDKDPSTGALTDLEELGLSSERDTPLRMQ
ncbi:hypothetical protein E3P92_00093 [Wallemia ichthyophaga]|uniref:GATA-type domain-containing protein n=1 Tax=Wallemia ichthyophaga TaxID=245174 RepID=A0A4T0J4M5_WALIC|nr:hypothetical protein E3P91_00094 [Wallemia ichthyophaga]TIA84265.1 hypothetical protein E3P98_00204 [Wallemia ichthyophaga]TIA94483.1 hypothetical protein E3P97_00094 [Wallemia ichthyophaga]TIB04848.1 hypothetical protein E3P95_00094 [Wallemia ichthyophaga]TIB05204.1 hypothetical protein E3P96_01315 [Wallemia ichthyophaga]